MRGGGLVVLLLRTMSSLRQLYSMTMDIHKSLRTGLFIILTSFCSLSIVAVSIDLLSEAHQNVTARFNERFLLSLVACKQCLVMDDQLNVLPISAASRAIEPLPPKKV